MYKDMKDHHECPAIQKQAADLLFIMEAPKLQIGDDEKVKIPVLSDLEKPAYALFLLPPFLASGICLF